SRGDSARRAGPVYGPRGLLDAERARRAEWSDAHRGAHVSLPLIGYRAMAGGGEIARAERDALRARGLLRVLEPLRSPPGAEIELRPGERLINFSSNDYLGLASDARIAEALSVGTRTWGAGAGASRLVCGD